MLGKACLLRAMTGLRPPRTTHCPAYREPDPPLACCPVTSCTTGLPVPPFSLQAHVALFSRKMPHYKINTC